MRRGNLFQREPLVDIHFQRAVTYKAKQRFTRRLQPWSTGREMEQGRACQMQ